MIEYRFRVPNAAVFTLYSYSKALEYRFRVPTTSSLTTQWIQHYYIRPQKNAVIENEPVKLINFD
jgi:hypothetical protein